MGMVVRIVRGNGHLLVFHSFKGLVSQTPHFIQNHSIAPHITIATELSVVYSLLKEGG